MTNRPDARPHSPKLVRNELFRASKTWLAVALSIKFLVFLVGASSILFHLSSETMPYILGGLMIFGELTMWRSEKFRGAAESLHRKLDAEDSFGWPVTNADISDILARCNCDLDKLESQNDHRSNFFASAQKPGQQRAVENLQESAWWSKHLAECMWVVCLVLMLVLVGISVALLIVSLTNAATPMARASVGRLVTSVILLIFSMGLFRFVIGYHGFARRAEQVEDAAKVLSSHPPVEQVSVLKLWHDYQLARASAPMLPTWIWKLRERKLNKLWNQYRAS